MILVGACFCDFYTIFFLHQGASSISKILLTFFIQVLILVCVAKLLVMILVGACLYDFFQNFFVHRRTSSISKIVLTVSYPGFDFPE